MGADRGGACERVELTPTARTLDWLREQGYRAGIVERWNPHGGVRIDLFGCLDVVAVNDTTTVGVQATSAGHVSDRVTKIRGEARDGALAWLMSPHRELWVVGWRKYAKPEDGRWWRPVVREVTLEDLGGEDEEATQGTADAESVG